MKKLSILIALMIGLQLQAQEFHYGFRAGLNYSKLSGPTEANETFTNTNGFNVGLVFDTRFTDIFGVKAELLFAQKGGQISYTGPSYKNFTSISGKTVKTIGTTDYFVEIRNNYLELPIMAYARLSQKWEVYGGAYVALLLKSSGSGTQTYLGKTNNGNNVPSFKQELAFNYLSDDANTNSGEFLKFDGKDNFTDGSEIIKVPTNVGSYHDLGYKTENYFSSLDYGLNAGITYFMSNGLGIGFRLNYGLKDLTNNTEDVSKITYDKDAAGKQLTRDDVDKNFSLQGSVLLSF
jgi:hypothetical protein